MPQASPRAVFCHPIACLRRSDKIARMPSCHHAIPSGPAGAQHCVLPLRSIARCRTTCEAWIQYDRRRDDMTKKGIRRHMQSWVRHAETGLVPSRLGKRRSSKLPGIYSRTKIQRSSWRFDRGSTAWLHPAKNHVGHSLRPYAFGHGSNTSEALHRTVSSLQECAEVPCAFDRTCGNQNSLSTG
jgi:hypothetical protein